MTAPSGASPLGPNDAALQDVQTEQDILLDSITRLLRQKVELDINNAARSLGRDEVDVPSIMSDPLVRRELRSLERHVTGFIEVCEDMLQQRIEDLVAPELAAGRAGRAAAHPLPEYVMVEEPLITGAAAASGIGETAAAAAPPPPQQQEPRDVDLEGLNLTAEDIRHIQDPTNRGGKTLYFFYGSLMDPGTLQRAAGLPVVPRMRPAHVTGYTTKLWGPYPALVGGRAAEVVRGVACEIEGETPKGRLEQYEGDNYMECGLDVRLDRPDGTWEEVEGVSFQWVGPRDDLKD